MYYTIYKGNVHTQYQTSYIALAKHTPFVNGTYLFEPGRVWFKYGETKESALIRLKESLPGHYWTQWKREKT